MNLAEGIIAEVQRVTKVRELFLSIGPAGSFGALMLQQDLDRAQEAMASGDVVKMVVAYKALQEVKE